MKFIPYSNETLTSFLWRISLSLNSYSYNDFYSYYVGNKGYSQIDHKIPLYKLYNAKDFEIGIDKVELFLDHTLFRFYAPFLAPTRISAILLQTFYSPEFLKSYVKGTKSEYKKICYCPICIEEDRYFKRFHQIPGVDVCPIHNVPLMEAELRNDAGLVIKHDMYKPKDVVNGEKYALFAKYMMENPIDIDKSHMEKFIFDILGYKEKWYLPEDCIKIICKYFDTPEQYISSIREFAAKPEEIMLPDGYELIGNPSNNFNIVKHKCGEVFIMNHPGIKAGLLCPKCVNTDNYRSVLSEMVDLYSFGKFELVDVSFYSIRNDFGDSTKITVKHKECGKTYTSSLYNWFRNNLKCDCEKQIANFNKKYSDYDFIRYKSDNDSYLVRAKKCNHEFYISQSEAEDNCYCKICSPPPKTTTKTQNQNNELLEAFKKDDDLKKEFTLLKLLGNNKIRIKHDICGKEFETSIGDFLYRERCPRCSKNGDRYSKLLNVIESKFPNETFTIAGLSKVTVGLNYQQIYSALEILIRKKRIKAVGTRRYKYVEI